MKFSIIAGLALAGAAFAAPAAEVAEAAPALEERTFGCLNSISAQILIKKYISILSGQTYNGKPPSATAAEIIASNYVEYSDSILSLEKLPLVNTPTATSRDQWVTEVTKHPQQGIKTLDLMNSCNKLMWHWEFPSVGQYPVKGFNLLTVDLFGRITRADIEFNSIAWGLDTYQLYAWCPAS